MNKVILIGNLGADPEMRNTNSGMAVANLRVATSERKKEGEQWVEHTEWHRVTCFGKTAENVSRFLTKGSKLAIEGKIRTTEYEKDGIRRWSTEVIADRVEFLGSKDGTQSGQSSSGYGGGQSSGGGDSVPF